MVSTSHSGKNQRLLERDAQLLPGATDEFARDNQGEFNEGEDLTLPSDPMFIPILVTNAPIFSTRYRPTEVSLDWRVHLPSRGDR